MLVAVGTHEAAEAPKTVVTTTTATITEVAASTIEYKYYPYPLYIII